MTSFHGFYIGQGDVSKSNHDNSHNSHDDWGDNAKQNPSDYDTQHTSQQVPNFIHIIFGC
jgi:hypothetical protein